MSSGQSINSEQFKAQQRQMWDTAAAGWQEYWQTFERGAQQVSDKIVELAEIKPGDKVLDIATGIGEPAVTAARKVGQSGKVIATDISPQMISLGRTRAKSLGLEKIIEFRESDAEMLDFPKSTFNAVLSRWGLMFLPDLATSLAVIRQMLVPGGILSAAVWSSPPKVPLLDIVFSTVRKQVSAPLPPPGTPGPFALADQELLKQRFIDAGFKEIRIQTVQVTFDFDSAESHTRFHQKIAAPIHAMLAGQTEERKREIWDAVTDAISPYADSHGRINIDNEAICVAGRA